MTSTADDQVVYTGMIMNKRVLVYGGTLWQVETCATNKVGKLRVRPGVAGRQCLGL